jgi:hypothetical protein
LFRGCLDNPELEKLAKAFGVQVILKFSVRNGSLHQMAFEKGRIVTSETLRLIIKASW